MQARLSLGTTESVGKISSISALDASAKPRHRWYFFKEAFSPSLVMGAINNSSFDESDCIFDPFCGSGTVPLTATQCNIPTMGIEVNPFLAFVSRTKLISVRSRTFEKYAEVVKAAASKGAISPLEGLSTFSRKEGAEKWLFNLSILRAFEGGWNATKTIYPPARDLLRLALIASAMDVCNAAKDGKCLRYRKEWFETNFDKFDFLSTLESRIETMGDDLEAVPLSENQVQILTQDSRTAIPQTLKGKQFKLCITSPPYLNSFDYSDVYRPELYLGKFVNSNRDLRALRMRTIRSHTQVGWEEPTEMDFGSHFVDIYKEIASQADSLWNRRIPRMIRAYFEDIRLVLRNMKRFVARRGSMWLVVSTSAYGGVEIPVDLIIADIGSQEGWYIREVSVMRYLRRVPVQQWHVLSERKQQAKPYLRESVIIFDNYHK